MDTYKDSLELSALCVVFMGCRDAPDRHHRIADELFDGPAIPLDDGARGYEIPRQQLPDVFRIAGL